MVDTTIKELSDLSTRLNQKSDQLNTTVSTINKKLGKLNLGVEVWLETPICGGNFEDEHDDEGHRSDRSRQVTLLGYCRVGDEWELAVKDATFHTEYNSRGSEYEELVNPHRPESLLKASRQVRIAALESLPDLLDALKRRAESILKGIAEAEKAAEKL